MNNQGELLLLLNRCYCEYRCLFCTMGSDEHLRQQQEILADFDYDAERRSIEKLLRDGRQRDQLRNLRILGNDPLNYPRLAATIRLARDLGYQQIVLATHGLGLDDPARAQELVDAGVTRFRIPVYGASAAVHDQIVRLPGAHVRLLRGLENLRRLPVQVQLHTLLLRQNLPELLQLARDPELQFVFPFRHDRADNPYDAYAPRLRDISPTVLCRSDLAIPCLTGIKASAPPREIRIRPEATEARDRSTVSSKRRPHRCTPENCRLHAKCAGLYGEYFDLYDEDELYERPPAQAALRLLVAWLQHALWRLAPELAQATEPHTEALLHRLIWR